MKKVGEKFDKGKLRWSLIPFDAAREIVRVLTLGAEKYTPGGWEHVEDARERYSNALLRHCVAWIDGEQKDDEWGLNHLAHGGCCLLFLLALDLRGRFDRGRVDVERDRMLMKSPGPEESDDGTQKGIADSG